MWALLLQMMRAQTVSDYLHTHIRTHPTSTPILLNFSNRYLKDWTHSWFYLSVPRYLYQLLFQSVFADWTKYTFSLGNVNYRFEKSRNSFCKVVYVLYFTLDKMPAWILLFKQFLWPNYINTRSVLNVHVYVNCKSGTILIL